MMAELSAEQKRKKSGNGRVRTRSEERERKLSLSSLLRSWLNYLQNESGSRRKQERERLSVLMLWTLTLNDGDNEVADTIGVVVVGVADTDGG